MASNWNFSLIEKNWGVRAKRGEKENKTFNGTEANALENTSSISLSILDLNRLFTHLFEWHVFVSTAFRTGCRSHIWNCLKQSCQRRCCHFVACSRNESLCSNSPLQPIWSFATSDTTGAHCWDVFSRWHTTLHLAMSVRPSLTFLVACSDSTTHSVRLSVGPWCLAFFRRFTPFQVILSHFKLFKVNFSQFTFSLLVFWSFSLLV